MGIGGIISAIIVGAIIGVLARLLLPGKQNISVILTIIVGIVAAFIGGFLASAIGVNDGGFNFLTLIIQLVVAVILVGLVAGVSGRRR